VRAPCAVGAKGGLRLQHRACVCAGGCVGALRTQVAARQRWPNKQGQPGVGGACGARSRQSSSRACADATEPHTLLHARDLCCLQTGDSPPRALAECAGAVAAAVVGVCVQHNASCRSVRPAHTIVRCQKDEQTCPTCHECPARPQPSTQCRLIMLLLCNQGRAVDGGCGTGIVRACVWSQDFGIEQPAKPTIHNLLFLGLV
jgi:hypothetical protein